MESYPPDVVTNYGITLLEEGIEPHITYVSPDGSFTFYINGGLAPFPGVTEGIALTDGIQGLHAPFKQLMYQSARQPGAVYQDTVFDPAELTFRVTAYARTAAGLRRVIRKWIAAWPPNQTGTLSWVTPEGGEWWAKVRMNRPPPEKLERTYTRSGQQTFTWSIIIENGFWQSYDSTSQFSFQYSDAIDRFQRTDLTSLGPSWAQTYSGGTGGTCGTDGSRATWTPSGSTSRTVVNQWLGSNAIQTVTVNGSPSTITLTLNGEPTAGITYPASAATVQTALEGLPGVVSGDVSVAGSLGGPYEVTFQGNYAKQDVPTMSGAVVSGGTNPYITVATTSVGMGQHTVGDLQVITAQFGMFHTWPFPEGAYIDLWARLNDAGTSGVRLRVGLGTVTLSRFKDGVETVLHEDLMLIPPFPFETYTFVCGTAANQREFQLKRSDWPWPILKYTEPDNASASYIGATYRGGGFGMEAGVNVLNNQQSLPPTIDNWNFGDNASVTQSGHLPLTNFGDQTAYPDFLAYGPGTFYFGDGPGTGDATIQFGPLTDNQIALIRSHPGKRGVYDMSIDPPEQNLNGFQSFISKLFSFVFNNNVPPLAAWFESLFGIAPSQGYLYPLLKGRWSQGVPPRPMSSLPATSQYAVKIEGGDARSKIVASITPQRRWPE